jgi:hypothetical protein
MKTQRIIFWFLFALSLLQSCRESKFDFRHKYVGEFAVTGIFTINTYSPTETWGIVSTTTVDFAEDRQSLQFVTADWAINFEVSIDKHGVMHGPEGSTLAGRFTDKDHFDASAGGISPVGGYNAWTLHGVRK